MTESAKDLLRQAIRLPAAERAGLADELLESLHVSDAAVDAVWLREAETRMAAFGRGEFEAVDARQVFAEPGRPV